MPLRYGKTCTAVVLLALLGVRLAYSSEGPQPGKPNEPAFTGKAIHVVLKGQLNLNGGTTTFLFLEQPQIRVFGDRSFLGGRSLEHSTVVLVPLSDVAVIQEFTDVRAMGKVYSLPRTAEK